MRPGDRPWREIACQSCNAKVMVLYRRRGRLMADYRTTAKAFLQPGDPGKLAHARWFSGIDVREEIAQDVEMNCRSTVDVECNCRAAQIDLQEIVHAAQASPKLRVPWTVG